MKQKRTGRRGADDITIKKSYYSFSKDYPYDTLYGKKRKRTKAEKRALAVRCCLLALVFVFIAACSFGVTETLLMSSLKPDDTSNINALDDIDRPEGYEFSSLRAVGAAQEEWKSRTALRSLIKDVARMDGDSVLLTFKAEDGTLLYSSGSPAALSAKANSVDNETVRTAVSYIHSRRKNAIALIWCFDDPLTPTVMPEGAVKYQNSDILWLDGIGSDGGRSYLDPYSTAAQDYIFSVVKDAVSFGFDGVALAGVCFPYTGDSSTMGLRHQDGVSRHACLKEFVSSVKTLLPNGTALFVTLDGSDDEEKTGKKYDGEPADFDCHGFIVDTRNVPADGETGWATVFYALEKHDTELPVIPALSANASSSGLNRALKKAGYENVVVFH